MKTVNYGERDNTEIVLMLGFFDCIHLGHIEIFNQAKIISSIKHCKIALFTFKNDDFSKEGTILSYNERILKAERLGVDEIISANFCEEFKNTDYEIFFETLSSNLNVKAIVCGFDYTFGKNAEGNVHKLNELCRLNGIELCVVNEQKENGQKISTTMIKSLLADGKITEANKLLCYPYSIIGVVEHGRAVGRTLGFPTANVNVPINKFKIKNGVYKTHVYIDGKRYEAITNYGARPTFDLNETLIETYLKDFNGDLYGMEINVLFDDYIRDIVKFYDTRELIEQLEKDKQS